ncbi:GntR family transcriptional regulator [Streptomyces sp. NBC_00378]|uniref:GntR family transcriptional regulator n=1 Tax=Streptomyces sp. NBC_00378 TaxID=2975732 RepID=UPI00225152F8|nr:GntR family transcriptional regulator [Streptomyces sp. NBC_00378]MCX5115495.1 GntR family transcriptional regulator [Streptomyces sp. NBC_00378]
MNANAIVAEIREGIATGEYRYGARLPSVRGLADQYGVSQQTAAAAYAVLSALGLARTERGSGTTVAAGPAATAHLGTFAPPDLSAALSWKPADTGAETNEETTLVRQLPASDEMSEWGIEPGSQVVERTRIRSVGGVPVQHKMTVLPYAVATLSPEGYDGIPPMLAPVGAQPATPPAGTRIADWLGWDVAATECAITAEPMRAAACEALQMPEGSPGFRIVSITRNSSGGTVYVTVTTTPLHHRVTLDIVG